MYQKIDQQQSFVAAEQEVLELWEQEQLTQKLQQHREGAPRFVVYDGPPTANGRPHIGHVLTRAIKDLIPRYRSMKGEKVVFQAGWDTHGLPVELEVEKKLGISGKPQIEAYGVEPFIELCKHSVWTYRDEWERLSKRVAYSADMEHAYVTYDNKYIESIWWALKRIFDRGLLYEGHKVVPYCPRCGTSLSSHEVAQGYKDVKERSVYVRMPVLGEEETYLAVWTTTPWTLPSNVGVCVNPETDYVKVRYQDAYYYVGSQRAEALFGAEQYEIIERYKGADLCGKHYQPLFNYAVARMQQQKQDAWFVVGDSYVTTEDGTGLVHLAPAFGEDDARVGREHHLPFLQYVKEDGTLDEATDWAGVFVKDADPAIIAHLEKQGLVLKTEETEHAYPHCWRCDTPLIYYARHGWFIRMTELREALCAHNQKINWIPDNVKTGRFGKFLENVVDWSLSRERYWGTPLPIWRCPNGHLHAIGSIEELKALSPNCPDDIELHRPWIDQVEVTCPICGEKATRVPEVIDCWFDSGSMPFAQLHYPFENKERFEKQFPANFISEAQDQTRGWFYSMLAIATLLFDQSSYENVICLGLDQDKNGLKMSKHKGNVVDPWEVIEAQGADAIRWYFYTNSQPWLPSRFSFEALSEGPRKFLGMLWNTYAFYVMYADIDGFNPKGLKLSEQKLTLLDRWMLSRLRSTIEAVDQDLTQYDITQAARRIQSFLDEVSNWYVRVSRERYWGPEMTADKQAAYMTLYTVLERLARLAAPFIPFMTERIYQNIVRSVDPEAPCSVHLCDFPETKDLERDAALEEEMQEVLQIVTLGRAARQARSIKTRQPLARLLVKSSSDLSPAAQALVLAELNVKQYEKITDAALLQDYSFKPELRRLGKRFGKQLPLLKSALEALDGQKAYQQLQRDGKLDLMLDGEPVELVAEDLLIEAKPVQDYATQEENNCLVALDLRLTEDLIEEGLAREAISKMQTMRKESDHQVTDRVRFLYDGDEAFLSLMEARKTEIQTEVLAAEISHQAGLASREGAKAWSINGLQAWLWLEP